MCGRKLTLLKTKIKDGYVCGGCLGRLPLNVYNDRLNYTGDELLAIAQDFEGRSDTYRNGHYQQSNGKKSETEKKKPTDEPPADADKFEQIRQYKKLLDEGIITEAEYEQKKKELLGV